MDRGRDRLLEFRHQSLDRVDQRDGIGAGRLLDRDPLGRFIVEKGADTHVLHRVERIADILDAHRRAVAIGNDDVAVSLGVEQLIIRLERDHLVGAFDRTLWFINRRVHERIAYVFETDAMRGEGGRVHLHARGIQLLAEDRHLPDSRHCRQPLP